EVVEHWIEWQVNVAEVTAGVEAASGGLQRMLAPHLGDDNAAAHSFVQSTVLIVYADKTSRFDGLRWQPSGNEDLEKATSSAEAQVVIAHDLGAKATTLQVSRGLRAVLEPVPPHHDSAVETQPFSRIRRPF